MKQVENKRLHGVRHGLLGAVVLLLLLMLAACGGGGGSDGIVGTGVDIEGIAATGDPIVSAAVTVKDLKGGVKTSNTGADGKFSVTGISGDGPYLMRVENGLEGQLYSIAHKESSTVITRNIHPYTDLIIRNWFATQNLDIDAEFAGSTAITSLPTIDQVNNIETEINNIVATVLSQYGITTDIDLLATPFEADQTGFDAFLLNNPVIINNNQITVIVNNIDLNIEGIVIDAINLNTDFTSATDTAPTTPMNVRALVAGTSESIVVWEASSDDKGVAAYNVYRNGSLIATTPYPVYSDSGLTTGTNYSYEIEAIDGRGQLSSKSAASTPIMLDTPDTTAPPSPTNLQAAVIDNDINLSWDQTQIDDVFGFRILRGSAGNVTTEIANLTSTQYTDFNLVTGTEYCYTVVAYDAAGNTSAPTPESCVNMGGIIPDPSSVTFSAATYIVSENTPSITITVNRAGDISEAISVNYATADSSATAGEDYSAVSGTLNWTANDSTAKTFDIQITSDALTEGDETVNLSLSTPSANTTIGANGTAVLTITDFLVGVCNGEITDRDITVDTTLSEPCYKVPNGITVLNPAKLTIAAGVRLEFAAGRQLRVNEGASLFAVGLPAQPIIITGSDATPGYWEGVLFYTSNSNNNQLDYVTVEYGMTNIDTVSFSSSPARINIKNTISRYASNLGVNIYDSSVVVDAFENNTLTLNDRSISLPAEMAGMLGADSSFSGNTDDRVHVYDQAIVTAQTWKKLDVPYYLSSTTPYDVDAALTLEAGVSLTFNSGSGFGIGSAGSLKAVGTLLEPILLTGLEKTPGYWDGIQFYTSNSTNNQLDHVTIEYGVINIDTVSFSSSPTRVNIKNTTSQYASDLGAYFYDSSIVVVAFENNTLTLNDRPISLPSEMVGTLGTDTVYSGNLDDRIHVFDQAIVTAQTWKKLDAPYFMMSTTNYDVDAALILDAGVSLTFNSGSGLDVSSAGSLNALGVITDPVLFTGLEKSSGYWDGIEFRTSNSSANQLDYVTVEYAGAGDPATSGNISSVCFPSSPTRFSVTNSTIKDSFGWGVYQYGNEADGCFITLSGNTYSNNVSGDVNTP